MRPALALAVALLLAAPAAGPAAAQEMALRVQGKYTLSGLSEGDDVCKLTLSDQPAIGGWGVTLAKDCYRKFGLSQDIAAWTVYADGSVGFIDPLRKRLLKFEPTEIGGYVAHRAGGQDIALDRDEGPSRERTPQERMSGSWSITGLGGEPRCSFTSKAAPGGKSGALQMKPGCAARWKAKGWASWRISGQILTVSDAKGAVLQRFKQGDVVTFEGEDAAGEPIYFSYD